MEVLEGVGQAEKYGESLKGVCAFRNILSKDIVEKVESTPFSL